MQPLEHRDAGVVAGDRLSVNNCRCGLERLYRLADQRISLSPVIAAAREQANLAAPLADDQAVAIVLDLVNPVRPDRGLFRAGRDAGLDKTRGLPLRG